MRSDISNFKLYSTGIVAEHKPTDTNEVLVYPTEKIPYRDGAIESSIETTIADGVDRSGKAYQDKVSTDTTLRCKWLNLGGSNRSTAPDVRKGEEVLIYQYGNKNEYYWATTGLNEGLRNKETVIHRWANNPDNTDTESSDANSVWLEISTHKKTFTFHTSSADGEAFTYAVRIDAANSTFIVTDDANNRISIESKTNKVELVNSKGTQITAEEKDITLSAPENINIKAKALNIEADTISIKASDTTIESNVGINGSTDIEGAINHTGHLTNTGGVTSNGVTVNTHKHTGNNQPPIPGS